MTTRRRKAKSYSEKMKIRNVLILVAVFVLVVYCCKVAYACSVSNVGKNQLSDSEVTALLHPRTNPEQREQIKEYVGFTVSFNREMHIPNWVSWELTQDEAQGNQERSQKFLTDPDVVGCPTTMDYRGSGYDRGHMAPAADMKWSPEAMNQCFYLTNICPQTHELNGGAWRKLEEKCRQWAFADSAIAIISGPVLTEVPDEYIGEMEVAVPKSFFKVILSPFANPPRGIGFVMPNGYVEGGMQKAAVTIDEVERLTGHDFFAALPDSIENEVEAQCDFQYWSNHRKRK